jgi:hypothetical protein
MTTQLNKHKMTIDIDKISNYLKNISVSENYNWVIPFDKGQGVNIFSKQDIDSFNGLTNFESNVHLKTLLSEKIIDAKSNNEIDTLKRIFEWTVHDWGGIRNGRNKIDNLYEMGIEAIKNENLKFERIASTSKILSFFKPSEHIIYDSRIAYSLNAIMLLVDASDKYFPVPAGTNSKMNAFNIEVLIRLKHKPNAYLRTGSKKLISNADKTLFFNDNKAYSIIKDTIQKINKSIYKNDPDKAEKPFYTEMLLFGIADTLIYDKIFNNVKVEID